MFITLCLFLSGVSSLLLIDLMNCKSSFIALSWGITCWHNTLTGSTLVIQNSSDIGGFFRPLKKLILFFFSLMILSTSCFNLGISGVKSCYKSLLCVWATIAVISFVCLIPFWAFILVLKLSNLTCIKSFSAFYSSAKDFILLIAAESLKGRVSCYVEHTYNLLYATKPNPIWSIVGLERIVLRTMLLIIAVRREKLDLSVTDERRSNSVWIPLKMLLFSGVPGSEWREVRNFWKKA